MKVTPLDILLAWGTDQKDLVVRLVSALNGQGIITDEEHGGLSSTMIEGWSQTCEAFLRANGYLGGRIQIRSYYSKTRGQVYALYNADVMTGDEADEHVKKIGELPV